MVAPKIPQPATCHGVPCSSAKVTSHGIPSEASANPRPCVTVLTTSSCKGGNTVSGESIPSGENTTCGEKTASESNRHSGNPAIGEILAGRSAVHGCAAKHGGTTTIGQGGATTMNLSPQKLVDLRTTEPRA